MRIKHFPNLRQTYEYDCGAQALQSVFAYYGIDMREEEIIKIAKTNKKGTHPLPMKKVAESHGFKTDFKAMTVKELKQYIKRKIPVILLIQAWPEKKKVNWQKEWRYGHYAVAIGYDWKKLIFEDPASIFRTYLSYKELEDRWHDMGGKIKYTNYGLAIYGKKPGYHTEKLVHMD